MKSFDLLSILILYMELAQILEHELLKGLLFNDCFKFVNFVLNLLLEIVNWMLNLLIVEL